MTIAKFKQQFQPNGSYCVIIANGEFPKEEILIELIRQAETIICCDGAISKLYYMNIKPDYIIGDCDSINPNLINYTKNPIIRVPEQNTTDLTKAFELASKISCLEVIILAATGLREDHTIANIALLRQYILQNPFVSILSDYGIFSIHNKECQLTTIPQQQLSFFTMQLDTWVSCQQLKWPLNKLKFDFWNQGTLNQATENYIKLNSNSSVIIYRAFEIKNQ